MSKIEIKKAGIRGGIFLAYEYNMEDNGVSAKNKTQSTAPIHDDLRGAFEKLIPHFILLTEELPTDRMKDIIEKGELLPEDIEKKYQVTDFELGGSEDAQTIRITGFKVLSNDKSVSFSTPSQKLYEEKTDGYKFDEYLREILEVILSEVLEYMDGKQAPRSETGTLDFGDEDDDEAFSMPSDVIKDLKNNLPEGVTVEVSTSKSKKRIAEPIIEAGEED
ncbi:hypothetical protein FNJ88_11000 [Chryseobacterium sp. SNU WT5]|uniref:hypothetical protein n=1 Tax=Chryseobacterium sp. SNU WT5 TaxID=2594269 RepID=UPI00117E2011|nr:hypothetical protein [Chryseobacterium sp. SNU WT5]QDP86046.1 hypothetical protein FNJ88_11000 [Chryseobacterium sp. SNU WT5]